MGGLRRRRRRHRLRTRPSRSQAGPRMSGRQPAGTASRGRRRTPGGGARGAGRGFGRGRSRAGHAAGGGRNERQRSAARRRGRKDEERDGIRSIRGGSAGTPQALWRRHGRRPHRPPGSSGRVLRAARAERGGQDHHPSHDPRPVPPERRHPRRARRIDAGGGAPGAGADRGRVAGRQPRPGLHGDGEPRGLRLLFPAPPSPAAPALPRVAPRVRLPRGPGRLPDPGPLGRHAPAPGDRPRPRERSRPPHPRRADDRPRPPDPPSHLGAPSRPQPIGGPPCSSPPTTWRRRSASATGSRSSIGGASSPRTRRGRWWRGRSSRASSRCGRASGRPPPEIARQARVETVDGVWHCHTSEPGAVLASLRDHPELEYLHRPANLEDVFLRLTGRELRD